VIGVIGDLKVIGVIGGLKVIGVIGGLVLRVQGMIVDVGGQIRIPGGLGVKPLVKLNFGVQVLVLVVVRRQGCIWPIQGLGG